MTSRKMIVKHVSNMTAFKISLKLDSKHFVSTDLSLSTFSPLSVFFFVYC